MKTGNQQDVLIATSIAPFSIEKQKLAVQTWLDLGFSVVSLNIKDEIDKLQSVFEGVAFYEVKRDARERYGKPFVYVNDILQYLQECDVEVCGIVNSDIQIRAAQDFVSYIYDQAKGSTVFASRIDIDSAESITGEMYGYGFDMFFFDRDLLQYFPVCDAFCLGIPWWDYWVPCIALKKSLNPKYLQDTVAYHIQHPINYSLKNWREVGIIFTEFFKPEITHTLQELLDNGKLEDLDHQLGPEITYNFILEFYQSTELLNYRKSALDDDWSSSTQDKFDCEGELSFYPLTSGDFQIQSGSDSFEHGELVSSQYDSLVKLAWEHYCDFQLDHMTQSLHRSLDYRANSPITKTISDWIKKFTHFSKKDGCHFDAYSMSCTPEWQQLINTCLLAKI